MVLGLAELFEGCDQGEHDLDRTQGRGAEQGAELPLEHGEVAEAVADGAVAEEGIALGDVDAGLGVFVGAEVDGADGERAAGGERDAAGVGLVVIFLGGLGGAGEVEELGAIEADALAPGVDDLVDFLGELNVAEDLDARAVDGDGGELAQIGEREPEVPRLLDLELVVGELLWGWIEDDDAAVAVEDRGQAVGRGGGEVLAPDDGGDSQGACDDGGVAGAPAQVGGKADDARAIKAGGLRRREVAGEDDGVGRGLDEAGLLRAQQVVEHAGRQVVDVVGLGLEGRIARGAELVGQHAQQVRDRELGADEFLLDHHAHRADQGLVGEHDGVDAEYRRGLFAHLGLGLGVKGVKISDRGADGVVEAFELALDGMGRDRATRDPPVLGVQDHDPPDDDAGRDTQARVLVGARGCGGREGHAADGIDKSPNGQIAEWPNEHK